MYDDLTCQGKNLAWLSVDDDWTIKCREKYVQRHVEYISYDTYTKSVESDEYIDQTRVRRNRKTLRSPGVKIMEFSRLHNKLVLRELIRHSMERMMERVSWYDANISVNPLSNIRFQRFTS